MNALLEKHRDAAISTDVPICSSLLTFAFASLLMLALAPVGDAHAQPIPVTTIDNAAGDSVLTVFEDGGFAVYGEEGTGAIPISGEGTRMMWYPAKAAFRAGEVGARSSGDEWDDAQLGENSIAFGVDTEASGHESTALGGGTTASGAGSTAMGINTTASETRATAMGFQTEATQNDATAMGDNTLASGIGSTAMGDNTIASGKVSTAMGDGTEASGRYSTAMGNGTTASGHRSTAIGNFTTASAFSSTAMGRGTTATTENSLTIGMYNDANRGNDDSDPHSGPLLVVGNGDNFTPSDALVLDQSGNLEISGSLSQNSDRRLKEQIQPLTGSILGKLGQIRPVHFRFKNEETHPSGVQLGLIAQEVQAQFPAIVSEGASGYLSVSYSKFTAVLLKGLQEQQAKIERLEARQAEVASLRKENDAIKKRLAKLEQRGTDEAAYAGWGASAPLGGLVALLLLAVGVLAWRRFSDLSSFNTLTGLGVTGLLVIGGFLASPAGEARAQSVPVTDIENAAGDSVLTVFEDGGLTVYGELGTGTIPIEGQGARMMWYPAKAAFRAGEISDFSTGTGNEWNDSNIGEHSVAFGEGNEASGDRSTAMGRYTVASGDNSTAMGEGTTATGTNSTAMGDGTIADGSNATAMGNSSEATSTNATAMGSATTASGGSSTAMGNGTTASGFHSTAMTYFTTASGKYSTAMGYVTEASADASTAMGYATVATTENSLSIGSYNDANREDIDGNPETGPLFVVGNGTLSTQSDALVLDQSGNMTIAGTLTQSSDRRLKTNIEPITKGTLGKLVAITPSRFQFKNHKTHPAGPQIGFIAQEVQQQFPELVSQASNGYLSVSYSKFTAVLLKGLQEQQAQIKKQREQIERLREQHTQIAALQAELDALKEGRSQNAGWGPAAGGLLVVLLLGGGVVAVRRWGPPDAASLLVLAGAGALLFGTAPAAAQTVTIQNGATVRVQNGSVIDLGTNSTLVEDESTGARLTGGTGVITATRTLNAPSSTNVAGFGAVISSSQNLGQTTITRGHAVQSDNNNESIARYYDIQPGQNNGSLNATLQFTYDDAELNGLGESSLILFRSGDGGSTYTTAGYDSRNVSANTVTLNGIDSFSRWTLGSESQPLPVELARFDVTATGNGSARLSWKTLSETGNDRFRVERRREAPESGRVGTWEQIGSVESEADDGTSSNALRYQFADEELPFEAQVLTYRLVQYDIGGGREVLGTQTLEVGGPQQFKLHGAFPNPVQSSATIRYELPEERPVTISVYDAMGRKVRTLVDDAQQGRRETTFGAKGLASGTYFVRMRAGGVTSTKSVVLVR